MGGQILHPLFGHAVAVAGPANPQETLKGERDCLSHGDACVPFLLFTNSLLGLRSFGWKLVKPMQ